VRWMLMPVIRGCSGSIAREVCCVRTAVGRPAQHALQDEGQVLQEDGLFSPDSLFQPSYTLPRKFFLCSSFAAAGKINPLNVAAVEPK